MSGSGAIHRAISEWAGGLRYANPPFARPCGQRQVARSAANIAESLRSTLIQSCSVPHSPFRDSWYGKSGRSANNNAYPLRGIAPRAHVAF